MMFDEWDEYEETDEIPYPNCPHCNSNRTIPSTMPLLIDTEVDQTLFQQLARCRECGYEWTDKWWEVFTPDGIRYLTKEGI